MKNLKKDQYNNGNIPWDMEIIDIKCAGVPDPILVILRPDLFRKKKGLTKK